MTQVPFLSISSRQQIYAFRTRCVRGLARLIRTVPVLAKLNGLSTGRIVSAKEWALSRPAASDGPAIPNAEYSVIFPETAITPIEPKRPTSTDFPQPPPPRPDREHFNYWDIRSGYDSRQGFYRKAVQHYDEVFLLRLQNGFVLGPSGAVLSPNRDLFLESIWTWDDWLSGDRSQTSWRLPSPKPIDGPAYVVASNQSEGYPHWLMEVLPRLFAASTLPVETRPTLIFKDRLKAWQLDSLELLGFAEYPRLELGSDFLAIDDLYFPSYVGVPGTPHPNGCRWVRETMMRDIGKSTAEKRIYITRRLAEKRKVINEPDILPIIESFGFEIVQAETLSLAEQIQLFANAESVVAAHGAGLANLMWVPEGCKVLEILDRDYVNDHFYNLSSILGLDYFYQLCNSVNAEAGFSTTVGRDHVKIDPKLLKTTLEAMFSK